VTGDQRPLAMVTGGARRVGRATATALARAGCDLIVAYRSSRGEAEDARRELGELGATVELLELDLDDLDSTASTATELGERLDRLDILVHNASAYFPTPLDEIDAERALTLYRANALGPLILSARLAPCLRRSVLSAGGSIVCMCDIHAMGRPRRKFAAYSMSKAALGEMVRSLARDLAPEVRVTGVAPGVVEWPESGYESDAAAQQMYLKRVPLGRAGTPEDAAETVRWLALEAGYLTGQIVRVDGGRFLA